MKAKARTTALTRSDADATIDSLETRYAVADGLAHAPQWMRGWASTTSPVSYVASAGSGIS